MQPVGPESCTQRAHILEFTLEAEGRAGCGIAAFTLPEFPTFLSGTALLASTLDSATF